ncbi:hypothetical protein L596_008218 [Steinernema carpocapsae]|uniref:Uncharacterized protein n=1 Tax=Steinernema carpocapsae TaxID=34508 RepID=A0A4U5PBX7_STECR|nr:hypothetical protein L596_008218 [Steinernema carpocapsae]
MSWISNLTNIADRAENLLNKLDQSTADVISKAPGTSKTVKTAIQNATEELLPSAITQLRDEDVNSERSFASSHSVRTCSTQGSSRDLSSLATETAFEVDSFNAAMEVEGTEPKQSSVMARSIDEKYQIMDFSWNKMQEEKQGLKDEISVQNNKIAKLELCKKEAEEEVKSMKSSLAFNQREFEEYRAKAQRILQSKDDILENLKKQQDEAVQNSGEAPANLSTTTDIKTYELEQERNMLKEDVESAQIAILGLRSDIKDLEEQMADERRKFFSEKKELFDKCHFWQNESKRSDEEVNFLKNKFDQARNELKREHDYVNERLVQKEREIRRLAEVERSRSGDSLNAAAAVDHRHLEQQVRSLADNLLIKQNVVERLQSENRALTLQLENSNKKQKSRDSYAVEMGLSHRFADYPEARAPTLFEPHSADSGTVTNLKSAYYAIDRTAQKVGAFMRRSPIFRLFLIVYCIVFHLWVFFLIITYTPEVH